MTEDKLKDLELRFVRGDGETMPQVTVTLGALFDLYAKEFGYVRPTPPIGIKMPECPSEFGYKSPHWYLWEDCVAACRQAVSEAQMGVEEEKIIDYLEEQIAFDLEAALIDGKIKPENYVKENRKTLRDLIAKALSQAHLSRGVEEGKGELSR